jgi:hypothetical protein
MNDQLKAYIERYTELEAAVRELIARKGNSLCSQCSCICCDAVMCIEAMDSPFLKLIHQQEAEYDSEKGFLTATGCALKKGRPSVCYEYFCDDHFYNQPDELHADVLKIIGSLLYHAIQNADGETSIDDIQTLEKLDCADFQSLEKNLSESFQALEIIQEFYRAGKMPDESLAFLKTIRIPKEFQ